jgi:FkbM family methyltransferase
VFRTNEVFIFQKALSDKASTEMSFHISENDGQSSSLLKMGPRHLEVSPDSRQLETVQVSVTTLDEELKSTPFSRAFMKVDVQGSELSVFRGAQETLKRVVAIHTEVSLTSLYENDSLATEVIDFLVSQGFIVYGIDPWFRDFKSSGELLQADVLFIKPQLIAEAK